MKTGKIWTFGDNVDTDQLAPGRYMKSTLDEMACHCLEELNSEFARRVRPGDVLAGGKNFGMGSSREQAVQVLTHLGVWAVIAISFGGIFQRNAFNLGLLVLECPEAGRLASGDLVHADPVKGLIFNETNGDTLTCASIPNFLLNMLEDGGLVPHLEQKLKLGTANGTSIRGS